MDFKEMTLLQLKAYAKEKGIRGISTLKKEQLVEKLMKSEKYEEKREEKNRKERSDTKSDEGKGKQGREIPAKGKRRKKANRTTGRKRQ